MVNYAYWAEDLTGGASGALDAIDGTSLADKDIAIVGVSTSSTTYFYWLDDDNAGAESSPTIITPDTNGGDKRWLLLGIMLPNTGLKILDTDSSHSINIKWNENDSANRTFNLAVAGADRTLTLNENLTIGDGYNVTITALGQANVLTLNEGLTIGDGNSGTITFSAASKVLTVENTTNVNQDLTTDAAVQFARVGFGVAADANAILYAPNATYANTALLERSGQTTDVILTAGRILSTKTSDMGDGFGTCLSYNIRDDQGTINIIGALGFKRNGADNTGMLVFTPYKAGSGVDAGTIDADGMMRLIGANIGSHDDITATSEGVAASNTTDTTFVTTNGDSDLDNVTLADGIEGQVKHICCIAEGNAADTWKITPANMIGGTQITFAGIGEGCILKMYSSGWVVVGNNGGTIT